MKNKVMVKTIEGLWLYVKSIDNGIAMSYLHMTSDPELAMNASKIEECRNAFPECEFKVSE